MSLLLPQTRAGVVRAMTPVRIHDDAWVDVQLVLDDAGVPPVSARLAANECPVGLVAGERVSARFVMGVVTKLERA